MKWGVVAIGFALFVALPIAGFFAARSREGSARIGFLLGAVLLFAVALWAFARGAALGFFEGFEETMLALGCVTLGHLVVAGLADGWIGAQPGWAERPLLLRRGVSAGLIALGFATVLLWPQID